jgi:hypothetical protein
MTYDLDHATCSARLRAFVAGELDDRTAAAVARHVESCTECAHERRAVALLLDEPAPLTADERSGLHAALDAGSAGRAAAASPRAWNRRLAPALAAAAILALVAIAAPFLVTGGDSGGSDAGAGGGAGRSTAETERGTARSAMENATPSSPDMATSRPRFDASRDELSRAGLRRMGRKASAAGTVSFLTGDSARLADRLTSRLVREAPARVADQVGECIETVLSQGRAIPVRGASGTLDGTEVVVVAFTRSRSSGGDVDRAYQVWAWPRGSCDAPVSFQAGRVR